MCLFVCTWLWKPWKQDWTYTKTLQSLMVIKERINHSVSQHRQNILIFWHRLSVFHQLPITRSLNAFQIPTPGCCFLSQNPDDPLGCLLSVVLFILFISPLMFHNCCYIKLLVAKIETQCSNFVAFHTLRFNQVIAWSYQKLFINLSIRVDSHPEHTSLISRVDACYGESLSSLPGLNHKLCSS